MHALLRSFWREPRVADPPRRVWRDWVLVGVLAALGIVEVIFRPDLPWRWASFVAAFVALPALLVRRTHPLAAVGVVFGAAIILDIPWIIQGGEPPGMYIMGYALVVAYALFRWGSGRDALTGFAVMLVPASLALILDFTTVGEAVGGVAVFLLSITAGIAVRYRVRARLKEADEIRSREREGLARDLHDTVAHHVSAIAISAQAGLATAATDPGAALAALRVIDAEASRALTEMRTIVRTLRSADAPELTPLPTLADVRELADGPTGGPSVNVAIDGDVATVPGPIATAAYRLVQESITNARRHARRAKRIDVSLTARPDVLVVEVTDDGERTSARGEGFGIVGMIERAERLGGTCAAGPQEGRGWQVRAVLPTRGASA